MHRSLRQLPVALALALLACGPGSTDPAASRAPGAAEAPREAVPDAPAAPSLPPPGRFRVERAATGFTVIANQAERLDVLRSLAREAGIELAERPIPPERAEVRVIVVGASLEVALAQVLAGLPYTIEFAVDPRDASHVPVRVSLVAPGTGAVAGTQAAGPAPPSAPSPPRPPALSPEQLERARETQREEEAEIARDLHSEDPEVRIEAVRRMGLDPASVSRLDEILARDPSPEVRAEAADLLASADSARAVESLLRGLGDPDPDVVIAVIEALEFAGNAATVAELRPLLGHPNPKVRQAASDAIELLE